MSLVYALSPHLPSVLWTRWDICQGIAVKPGRPFSIFCLCLGVCCLFYLVFSHHLFRTSRCIQGSILCKFQIGICIGRSDDCAQDEWFLTVQTATNNDHPPPETSLLRKPARLHSPADLELVKDALASYAGAGVARSLYFYRTGEVLDHSMLNRLKSIKK